MRFSIMIAVALALTLGACSGEESPDMLIAEGGGHPVCKSAKSTLNYQMAWQKDLMAKRDSGVWTQEKFMMVMNRLNEYAHKIDPQVRQYSSFCDDLDRIRGHYGF